MDDIIDEYLTKLMLPIFLSVVIVVFMLAVIFYWDEPDVWIVATAETLFVSIFLILELVVGRKRIRKMFRDAFHKIQEREGNK